MTEFDSIMNNSIKNNSQSDSTSSSSEILGPCIYTIKIQELFEKFQIFKPKQLFLYLNLTFSDNLKIQTPCIDILSTKNFFQVKGLRSLDKIQVIDYDTLKKIAKISLKGTERQFNVSYRDTKKGLNINISKRRSQKDNQRKQQSVDFKKNSQVDQYSESFFPNQSFI